MGHGAPGVCAVGATGLLPPGVVFAICPGDGEATPVRCPGGAGDVCTTPEAPGVGGGEVANTVAGELAGDAAGVVAGELPDEGDVAGAAPAAGPAAAAAAGAAAAPAEAAAA